MGIKSFLGRLAGSRDNEDEAGDPVEYKGYLIRARPKAQGAQFYTAGVIAKSFPEGMKEQYFIRADTHSSRELASEHAIIKGRQIIDEQGDRLFHE